MMKHCKIDLLYEEALLEKQGLVCHVQDVAGIASRPFLLPPPTQLLAYTAKYCADRHELTKENKTTARMRFIDLLQEWKRKVEQGKSEATDVYVWLVKNYQGNMLVENCCSLNNIEMNVSCTAVLNQILVSEQI